MTYLLWIDKIAVMDASYLEVKSLSDEEYSRLLKRTESDLSEYIAAVKPVIESVRSGGDQAVCDATQSFDGAVITPETLQVTEAEFDQAVARISDDLKEAIDLAIKNVSMYHQGQMPSYMSMNEVQEGITAGHRFSPIPRVACYVPRGKGSFPSVLIMTAAPAIAAKVPELIVLTPPNADGSIDDATLYAAQKLGIDKIFKCGGSQAVAAVAFGTETIPKCDKISGPSSPWGVAAKKLLADILDPGVAAGPSESVILADSSANPWKATLDLVNESEHGPDSSAFLVTDSREVAEAVVNYIPEVWEKLGEQRRGYSQEVLTTNSGGVLLCENMEEAIKFSNDYAPEHLQVHSKSPLEYLDKLKHAGEILLGENAAICLGNFVLGPNAVLPTNMAARTSSPLSVYDYLKRTSIAYVSAEAYPELAKQAKRLAEFEGFEAHALAVSNFREKYV